MKVRWLVRFAFAEDERAVLAGAFVAVAGQPLVLRVTQAIGGPMVRSASTISGIGVETGGAEGIRYDSAGALGATVEDMPL